MITLFVLDQLEDYKKPIVYVIPLEKQIEVEKIARKVAAKWENLYHRKSSVTNPVELFEDSLNENEIEYECMGRINFGAEYRQINWIDDKIPRALV